MRLVVGLHDLAELSARPSNPRDNLFVDLDAVRRMSRQIRLEAGFGNHDHDAWESRLVDLLRDKGFSRTRKGSGYKYSGTVTRTDVLAAREALFNDLQQFKKAADADLAALLHEELRAATDRYETLKFATGMLDFTDLLARARDLVRDNGMVRRHLQRKFRRLFIDEFQDTDPLQAEILLLLAADDPDVSDYRLARPTPGKLFIVGDPKQSIYRFRGTDVQTYWQVSRQIEQHGGRRLQLTTSFRRLPNIQRFVNAAFRSEMVADDRSLQPDYVALSPARPARESQPSVVALPVPRPYSERGVMRKVSAWAVEKSLPDAIAAYIAWLVDPAHGWQVADRDPDGAEQWVPLQARHVAILFRRFTSFGEDITRPYVNAIEARGIPHLLVGGKAFHGREEVEVIRAALAAIEWPDDELSVFATLRGSLFAIEDAHLFEYKSRFGVEAQAHSPASVPDSTRARWQLRPGARAVGRADLASRADRRCTAAAAGSTSPPQLSAGRRHGWPSADGNPRPCRLHPAAGRRAGPGQRAARGGAGPSLRSGRRHLLPRFHRRVADRGRERSGRSADSRRVERRSPHHDGAQGQGARVPGRRSWPISRAG